MRRFGSGEGRTLIHCGDKLGRCDFSRAKSPDIGLPVLVVDDEIYRRPPSMLIATVDKFAMMAWRGQVRTLFGRATQECPRHGLLWPGADCSGKHQKRGSLPAVDAKTVLPIRPPDLIIQDEFHLISGPLGTMVGLYETAVDELATWSLDGTPIRPKVIASSATVRKADEQVNNVFLRRVAIFPPHGLDVEDNFFSVQRPISQRPGRRYMGICSPGSARPAVLIRVYTALLTAAQSLFERFGSAVDPWMTTVGYFNSLRELGGMRRLAEDDVQTRAYRVNMSRVARPGLTQRSVKNVDELTSRVSSKDIPRKLDQLEINFASEWNAEKGVFEVKRVKGETQGIDVVLATNMLSVGVDVNRLGSMAVNGQPKSTAEYIQATSRVGRAFPGLVCSVLTWSRPRDLSHYESFEHYHATFYKHVEAQSVTPLAPRALDRGLTGTMISWLRLAREEFNSNLGAEQMDSASRPEVGETKSVISERAWRLTDQKAVQELAEAMVGERCDEWIKEATRGGRKLGYEAGKKRKKGEDDVAGLLKKPGLQSWDHFTVPMSMREVEPGVRLVMLTDNLPEGPPWKLRQRPARRRRIMNKLVVGDVRPSQLLWTYGPGALVDLPNLSVITMGLDRWEVDRCLPIEEARLLDAVRRVLGPQVVRLRMPPVVTDDNASPLTPEGKIGVPVRPFPRWLRCVRCGLLAEFDSGLFTIKENLYRPDQTHFIHGSCEKGSHSDAVPARFLLACRNGHLDDFPWHFFVHGGASACKGTLRFFERGASLQTENLWVKCDACSAARSLVHAFGSHAKVNLPACRGRHPHLDVYNDDCKEDARTVLLGSTNSWFPVTLSVLAIPHKGDSLGQLVADGWEYFQDAGSAWKSVLSEDIEGGRSSSRNEPIPPDDVWDAVEKRKSGDIDKSAPDPEDIKRPEWTVLTHPSPPTDWPLSSAEVPCPLAMRQCFRVCCQTTSRVNALIDTLASSSRGTTDSGRTSAMADLCRDARLDSGDGG